MNKPLCIVMDDFRKELAKTVNSSGLPLCVTELIIKELYDEAKQMSRQELMVAKNEFQSTDEIETV